MHAIGDVYINLDKANVLWVTCKSSILPSTLLYREYCVELGVDLESVSVLWKRLFSACLILISDDTYYCIARVQFSFEEIISWFMSQHNPLLMIYTKFLNKNKIATRKDKLRFWVYPTAFRVVWYSVLVGLQCFYPDVDWCICVNQYTSLNVFMLETIHPPVSLILRWGMERREKLSPTKV